MSCLVQSQVAVTKQIMTRVTTARGWPESSLGLHFRLIKSNVAQQTNADETILLNTPTIVLKPNKT